MEQIISIMMIVFLFAISIIDIKKQWIPAAPLFVGALLLAIYRIAGEEWIFMGLGTIPGAIVWGISRCSRGAVGSGDAMIFILTGMLLGVWGNLELLMLSFGFAGIASLYLVVVKKVRKTYRIPFIPFVAFSFTLLTVARWG